MVANIECSLLDKVTLLTEMDPLYEYSPGPKGYMPVPQHLPPPVQSPPYGYSPAPPVLSQQSSSVRLHCYMNQLSRSFNAHPALYSLEVGSVAALSVVWLVVSSSPISHVPRLRNCTCAVQLCISKGEIQVQK